MALTQLFLLSLQCSHLPRCSRNKLENKREVRAYYRKYGRVGAEFSCLYNPAGGSKEVIQKRLSDEFIRPFWLWPTVITAFFIVILLLTHCTCGWRIAVRKYPPDEVVGIAESLRNRNIERLKHYSPGSRRRLIEECYPKPGVVVQQPRTSPPPSFVMEEYDDDGDMPYTTTV